MSNDLLEEYKKLHADNPGYGTQGLATRPGVRLTIDYLKPKTVLDYGCGKGRLIKELAQCYPHIEFYGYDPAIPEYDTLPIEKADLVINTDVLEHIPEGTLPSVVAQIASISENVFFILHHALAGNVLPNGENAHCTVKPPQWYYELFCKHFQSPYPLPGRSHELSAVITFSPSIEWINDYHQAIAHQAIAPSQFKLLPRSLGLLIACFIPKKKNRQYFRQKYVQGKR